MILCCSDREFEQKVSRFVTLCHRRQSNSAMHVEFLAWVYGDIGNDFEEWREVNYIFLQFLEVLD